MAPIFNSRDPMYKTPFGAVASGEAVTFTLRVPCSYHCTTPYLFLIREGETPSQLLLPPAGNQEGIDVFSLTIHAGEPGLYFYYFDLWTDYRKLYKGLDGNAVETTGEGNWFQMLVHDAAYTTPAAAQGGVMYQIFPDRFLEGNPQKPYSFNERIYIADKNKEPYFWPDNMANGFLTKDYYGGDLAGIEKRLPFLYTLGITWIYLNPIFEAHSNHRYNTADYLKVDPYLGTNEDFTRLCKKAADFGIRIILDGVFSHTGSDSIYFNKDARYPSFGAWQGPESPYREWYYFHPDGKYESWWGFQTLPACNKENPDFRRFICGEEGVIDTWLKMGASGFRLDVADELPDDFIAEIRTAIKRGGDDKLLIGEVWEDASNKEAYSQRRQYFWGNGLDGVMNYPFRNAIINFMHTNDAPAFKEQIMTIAENYPAQALAACTTHLSTHDTERIITALAGEPYHGQDRDWQSSRMMTPQQYHLGISRLRLAFVLQFTLPGIPCVYYGDEIGMQGYKDPFNRGYYNWNSSETRLIPLLMQLSKLRKACPAFIQGSITFLQAENGILIFERECENAKAAVAINCSNFPVNISLLGENVYVPVHDFAFRHQ